MTISAIVAMNSSDQSRGNTPAPSTPTSENACHNAQHQTAGTMKQPARQLASVAFSSRSDSTANTPSTSR